MTYGRNLLQQVMLSTSTEQADLAGMAGLDQTVIRDFLAGKCDLDDGTFDRLLSCMGFRLEVVRTPAAIELPRSAHRLWMLHRSLSRGLTPESLEEWEPTVQAALERIRATAEGQAHKECVERWAQLVSTRNVDDLKRVMTGLDSDAIEMREVSPFCGIRPPDRSPLDLWDILRHRRELEASANASCRIYSWNYAVGRYMREVLDRSDDDDAPNPYVESVQFNNLGGLRVDGIDLGTAVLPAGWRDRLNKVGSPEVAAEVGRPRFSGWCLDRHDWCVVRLCAGPRERRDLVDRLISADLVSAEVLTARLVDVCREAPASLEHELTELEEFIAERGRIRSKLRSAR